MTFSTILNAFSRLSVNAVKTNVRTISTNVNPLCFKATEILYGEPLRKKKRIDPAVIRHREERKKRKIEKSIRRLQKHARQLKPINELESSFQLLDEIKIRSRPKVKLSEDELDKRVTLIKDWARFKRREYLSDLQMTQIMAFSQEKALEKLREVSEELYQEAIQVDLSFIPHKVQGPVQTPAIKDYDSPDGEYVNITKRFEGEDPSLYQD